MDFSDGTIAECTPAAEEMTSPLTSSNTPSIVNQESLCDSNTSAMQAIDPEDSLESRMELLRKLNTSNGYVLLWKLSLMQNLLVPRILENDEKRTHYFTGLPSYSVFATLLELLSKAIKPYTCMFIME